MKPIFGPIPVDRVAYVTGVASVSFKDRGTLNSAVDGLRLADALRTRSSALSAAIALDIRSKSRQHF